MTEAHKISTQIRDLFRETFKQNCALEDSMMTTDESKTIEEIETIEVIENLKEIITGLLSFKQKYLSTDKAELVQRAEQFESMLQKLEANIRAHIGIEHQLKLHIETSEARMNEMEAQNNKQINEIKELQEKIKGFQRSKPDKNEIKEYVGRIEKLEKVICKKDITIVKMENELNDLRMKVQGASFDSENFCVGKGRENSEGIEEMKLKIHEKNMGMQKLQRLLRENSLRFDKNRSKGVRSSMNDDGVKSKIGEHKGVKYVVKVHNRSSSEQVRPRSVGKRPPSR